MLVLQGYECHSSRPFEIQSIPGKCMTVYMHNPDKCMRNCHPGEKALILLIFSHILYLAAYTFEAENCLLFG